MTGFSHNELFHTTGNFLKPNLGKRFREFVFNLSLKHFSYFKLCLLFTLTLLLVIGTSCTTYILKFFFLTL
jgi:hypothetical protein